MLPAVDDDEGDMDEYGRASSRAEAIIVASTCFVDRVVDAYLGENITLTDGRILPGAWVAVTEANQLG